MPPDDKSAFLVSVAMQPQRRYLQWLSGVFRAFLVAVLCTATPALQQGGRENVDVKEVQSAQQFYAAIKADPTHIYITSHLDLRELQTVKEDSAASPTLFFPGTRLEAIVV
jgi:hypothetical protein